MKEKLDNLKMNRHGTFTYEILKVQESSDTTSELDILCKRKNTITQKILSTTNTEEKSKLLQELREVKDEIKLKWNMKLRNNR